jgi:hypothetical protein
VDSCNETTDSCETDVSSCTCLIDADCDNGLFCDGTESCDLTTNTCISGTAPTCDDGISCSIDSCNDIIDACEVDVSTCV